MGGDSGEGGSWEGALWGVGRSPWKVWRRGDVMLPRILREGFKLCLQPRSLHKDALGKNPCV